MNIKLIIKERHGRVWLWSVPAPIRDCQELRGLRQAGLRQVHPPEEGSPRPLPRLQHRQQRQEGGGGLREELPRVRGLSQGLGPLGRDLCVNVQYWIIRNRH